MTRSHVQHDRDACITMGICESIAPEYFQVQDDGTMAVQRELVDPADLGKVREAVAACPTGALRIVER